MSTKQEPNIDCQLPERFHLLRELGFERWRVVEPVLHASGAGEAEGETQRFVG